MARLTVIYDSCVLYPAPLRDLLMHLALTGLFRACWTEQIHEEWIRNILKNRPDLSRSQLERTRELMNSHAGDCLIDGYQRLIPRLQLPDPDDRHVLAAAIKARATIIVTFNLQHFPTAKLQPLSIRAVNPDDFIMLQIEYDAALVCAAVRRHRLSLKNPPKTVTEYLETLTQQQLHQTAAALSQRSGSL